MKRNLTNYLNLLQAEDMNSEIGPFHLRLNQTMKNMNDIIAYVCKDCCVMQQLCILTLNLLTLNLAKNSEPLLT